MNIVRQGLPTVALVVCAMGVYTQLLTDNPVVVAATQGINCDAAGLAERLLRHRLTDYPVVAVAAQGMYACDATGLATCECIEAGYCTAQRKFRLVGIRLMLYGDAHHGY